MSEREPHPAEFRVAPGARLHHLDAGHGDPVLLLHGSLTDARYWQRSGLLPALAATYRVIAPSRRHNHPHPASHEMFLDAPAPVAATLLDFFAAHPG